MSNSNWNKLITTHDYYELALSNWPGWDKPDSKEPAFVKFEIIKGHEQSSLEIASEWDDISEGGFWYRDFTDDAMPFVENGETYRSIFVFQYISDFEKFKNHFN